MHRGSFYPLHGQVLAGTQLSHRELDVLACWVSGKSTKAAAALLGVSPSAVDNATTRLRDKLQCHSKQDIVTWAEQLPELPLIRQHYHRLLLYPAFIKTLASMSSTTQGVRCVLLHHRSMASTMKAWQTYLSQAGVAVICQTYHDDPSLVSVQPAEVVLYWADEPPSAALRNRLENHRWWWCVFNHSSSVSDSPHTLVLESGYIGPLQIIQRLQPDTQIQIQPFLDKYHSLLNQHITIQSPPIATSAPPRYALWLASMALWPAILLGYHWWLTSAPRITWHLPPLMSYYTERAELTRRIWQQLQQDPGKGTVSLVGLRGMGGVGKTSLAAEAIHYPHRHYHFRGWFKAETRELLQTEYLDLGTKMGLFTQQMNDKQKVMVVQAWLESQPSTLLVYDNAPDMDTLHEYLPHRGHILITSRNQHVPHPIDVEGMQERQAIQLLDKLVPDQLKRPDVHRSRLKDLAKQLAYLPLALSQAGAYMTQHQLSVADYLKRYQKLQTQLLAQHTLPPQDLHEPIYVTWNMNIEAIRRHRQGKQAMQLLDVIAHLYPERIPKALLAQYVLRASDDAAITRLDRVLDLLKTYSLVKASGDYISVHRLVHAYLRQRHAACILRSEALAMKHLSALYHADEQGGRMRCRFPC